MCECFCMSCMRSRSEDPHAKLQQSQGRWSHTKLLVPMTCRSTCACRNTPADALLTDWQGFQSVCCWDKIAWELTAEHDYSDLEWDGLSYDGASYHQIYLLLHTIRILSEFPMDVSGMVHHSINQCGIVTVCGAVHNSDWDSRLTIAFEYLQIRRALIRRKSK